MRFMPLQTPLTASAGLLSMVPAVLLQRARPILKCQHQLQMTQQTPAPTTEIYLQEGKSSPNLLMQSLPCSQSRERHVVHRCQTLSVNMSANKPTTVRGGTSSGTLG